MSFFWEDEGIFDRFASLCHGEQNEFMMRMKIALQPKLNRPAMYWPEITLFFPFPQPDQ